MSQILICFSKGGRMSDISNDNPQQYMINLLESLLSDEGVRWLIIENDSREYSSNFVDVR